MTSDLHARSKNGKPAHRDHRRSKNELNPIRGLGPSTMWRLVRWPPISSTSTGTDRTSPIQKRRLMSRVRRSARFRGDHFRFERHPADRAVPRSDLPHLRMHRAGVNHPFGLIGGRALFGCRRGLSIVPVMMVVVVMAFMVLLIVHWINSVMVRLLSGKLPLESARLRKETRTAVTAIATEMVALRVSQANEGHPAVERKCSNNGSGRAESRSRAEPRDRRLRIKISLSTRAQVKNNSVQSRENHVAQAAYAIAASLMPDRVEITLFDLRRLLKVRYAQLDRSRYRR